MLVVDPVAGPLSTTLIALVDKTISLIREGHARDASAFRNCVEPLYGAVDAAHASYTKTFLEYESLIRKGTGEGSWNVLFARIDEDMLLTMPQRVKIEALRLRVKDPTMRPFRDSVGEYVRNAVKSHQFEKYTNVPRLQLLAELEAILVPSAVPQPPSIINRAVNVVRRRLRSLQYRFVDVTHKFENIRSMQR